MNPDRLEFYSQMITICWVVAAVAATAFPVLYSFSSWSKSTLGRVMMSNAIATAFLVDLVVVSRLRLFNVEISLILYIVAFIAFACTKTAMSVMMIAINYRKGNKNERIRSEA